MSDAPADSPLEIPAPSWSTGPQPPREGWSRKKFIFVLLLVLAFHVALIVLFGTKKQISPRAVTNLPHVELVNSANEFIALGDPTLFARPNKHDVVTAFWRREPPVAQPDFDWPAPSGYLEPTTNYFGKVFHNYMSRKKPPQFSLSLKPDPKVALPEVMFNATAQDSVMQLSPELVQRGLLTPVEVPSISYNDVLEHSVVQAVVDTAGNVASAVIIQSCGSNDTDQQALQIVRNLSFAPSVSVSYGDITFMWHTASTNAVPSGKP